MENVIGFIGYECEDIAIYLARIIQSFGKKIGIVDRTEQEMLCEMVGLGIDSKDGWKEGEYCNVLITNRGINPKEYDMVFYLFGYRLSHPKLYECGVLFMVTDGVPAHASLLQRKANWECKSLLLIRNLTAMKHSEEYLASLAGKENDYLELPYDEKDARMKCSLGAYSGCEIKRLSMGMKRILVLLITFLDSEYREECVWKLIKKL